MARLCLAIEISNPSSVEPGGGEGGFGPGVAVGEVGSREAVGKELLVESERHDDDLMPAIDRLFRRVGATPRGIAQVAVSVGPGGYTALRIAVATAKMLCEATGAACITVPSALVVSRRVQGAKPFAVALASKGEAAWITEFRGDEDGSTGRLITASDVASLDVPLLVGDRFLPAQVRAAAIERGIAIEPPRFDAAACLEAAIGRAAIDPLHLVPLYPREPEAVTQWRKRHGGPRA
jgi:tRNA threonylcarbamoyladenosine biosynthesis protein TsaB